MLHVFTKVLTDVTTVRFVVDRGEKSEFYVINMKMMNSKINRKNEENKEKATLTFLYWECIIRDWI